MPNGVTVVIENDQGVALSSVQVVNVGEHVRAQVNVVPSGTVFSNPEWLVTGFHIKDWVPQDAEPVAMEIGDYQANSIHLLWKEPTPPGAPYVLLVSVLVGSTIQSASVEFQVERAPKPEKVYSSDILMEYHNNWHMVYMFSAASTRRGDAFLGWHRSQLDYYNTWRAYFGYEAVPYWDPVTPWISGSPQPSREHPSTFPAPAVAFSTAHDAVTLDLTSVGRANAFAERFVRTVRSECLDHVLIYGRRHLERCSRPT